MAEGGGLTVKVDPASPSIGKLCVFSDLDALADGAAKLLCSYAKKASGTFRVSLSGGSTPKPVYEALAKTKFRNEFPWSRVQWFLGDERFVAETDPQSNIRMIRRALFDHAPVPPENIHAIPTENLSPEAAASSYQRDLEAMRAGDGSLFDFMFLGLGDDGHTASLLPGQPILQVRDKLVDVVPHGRDNVRISLTYPALNASALIVFLVSGEGKRAIMNEVLKGGSTVPAAGVNPAGEVFWFADKAAAGDWVSTS